MSRSIVGSLFGPTPEQLQRERMQQQAILSQNASRVSPSFGIGYNVGTMLGQGLGALFGVKDPELQRATGVRKILQDTQSQLGAEAQDPALLFTTLQEKLSEAGFGEEATLAAQQAQEAQMRQAQIARQEDQGALYKAQALKALREDDPQQQLFFKLAEKASPQSVATALANGMDIAMLDSPDVQKFSPDAQRLIDAGLQYGTPDFNAAMLEIINADKAGKTRGSGTDVTVNLGEKNQGIITKEVDIPIVKAFSDNANAARNLAKDSRTIADLLKNAEGGQLLKLTTRLAKDLGLESETIKANDLANALATKGAVNIRAVGSGSTSDLEFKAYLEAFPSLANSKDGRELMAKYAERMAERQSKLADYGRRLIVNNNFSQESLNQFDESLGPVLGKDFYSFQKQTPANIKINPKTKAIMDKYGKK